MIYFLICIFFSYLLGSINTAVIFSKSLYGKDIRQLGSGNAGATNALRVFGKKAGTLVFLVDFFKGLLAVIAARLLIYFFDAPYEAMLAAGFFVQVGHTFPVFFSFKGGKGVATAAGAAFGIMPLVAAILIIAFALITVLTKIVSVASASCAAVYPLLAYFLSKGNANANFVFAVSCSVLIAVKHAPNFIRLINGTEKKISFKKKDS